MNRRSWLATLPACLAMSRAFAQGSAAAAPKYVVMSLVGDELTYVGAEGDQVGTHLNHNRTVHQPTTTDAWDISVLQTIAAVLPTIVPNAAMTFLKGSKPAYFSDQIEWFDGDRLNLPEPLGSAIAGEHADFLLLLTKWRGDAIVSDGHESRGKGKLSGLGFYMDAAQRMARSTDLNGFTAPYVYAKLALVDLSKSRLVRDVTVHVASPRQFNDYSPGPLQDLLIDSVRDAAERVLKAS